MLKEKGPSRAASLPIRRLLALVVLCIAYGVYWSWSRPLPPPPPPPLLPVSGRVFVNGRPLDRGLVTYFPDSSKGNTFDIAPRGEVQNDGSYSLKTRGEPGAPAGWYRVSVFATRTPPPENPGGWVPDWIVDEKYVRPASTDLLVEVREPLASGRYDLRVTFHPPSEATR